MIRGIGVVTCVYYNPDVKLFWAIDYRIFAPEQAGKSKFEHVMDMLKSGYYSKQQAFSTVLMDTCYAASKVMLLVDALGKIYYCTLKSNRLVSRTDSTDYHQPLQELVWSETELKQGMRVHLNKFPNHYHVQLFCITGLPAVRTMSLRMM